MKTWLKIGSDFINVEEIEAVQEELESEEEEGKGEEGASQESPVIYLYMKSGVRLRYQYDEPEAMSNLWVSISEAIGINGTIIDAFEDADEETPSPAGG